ncbi:hypothetical protein BKA83DRAFT_1746005 [Pisolithus microcarpus]|nr:hypothetical protein BKA83DRAFT_1746005 [Pisolithus microcarpus]
MVVALEWTQRLDFTLDFSNESEDLERCVKHVAYVIRSLSQLQIVSFANSDSLSRKPCTMPFSVLDALRCSANLLCILDWSGRDFFPQLHQLEELLRDLPNLCVLHCPELVWADGSIPSSILSSVTAVAVARLVERVGHPGEGGLHEACVSLREFIYYGCELPRELIMHYGKYLTVVKWCHS